MRIERPSPVPTEEIKDRAVTAIKLANELQENLVFLILAQNAFVQDASLGLALRGADSGGNAGTCEIQVLDSAGNNKAGESLLRTWITEVADLGAPSAQNDYSVGTGTEYEELVANASYMVLTDSTGKVVMDIAVAAPDTVYCMAEVNGNVESSGGIAIT